MKGQLTNLIEKFKGQKVLVIGDAILDMYIKGNSDRLCREAPVPVINVEEQEASCGGAANTAINVAALGAEICFLTVIGDDESGKELIEVLKKNNVNTECIIQDPSRKTIAKKRIVASSNILLRIDEGNTNPISEEVQHQLNNRLESLYFSYDAIILSDYEYGLITDSLIDKMEELKSLEQKILIIDSKDLSKFARLQPTAVKPNYEEAVKVLKLPKLFHSDRVEQILENGSRLLEVTGARAVAATIDADGTIVFERGTNPYRIYTEPQDNKRAIGAGDTFISAITLALLVGGNAQSATEIGSAAASIILQKEGTAVCTASDLKDYFNENPKYIHSLEELTEKVKDLKKGGKRIVFTNGCFDILHRGHVNFLNQAKEFGDILVVGINSDWSIKRVKGDNRPINTLEDRLEVLSALQSVDYLISFEEDTSIELVRALMPDVFVKGGTYTIEAIPEALLVKQLGGQVKIVPFTRSHSTTQIINKIKDGMTNQTQMISNNDYSYARASGLE